RPGARRPLRLGRPRAPHRDPAFRPPRRRHAPARRRRLDRGGPGLRPPRPAGERTMKVIALSDHPAEMLEEIHSHHQAAVDRERAEYRKALAQHEEALARHGRRLTALRRDRDRARADRRWFTWAKTTVVTWHTQQKRPRPPVQRQASRPAA